jgi:hypothetical protein
MTTQTLTTTAPRFRPVRPSFEGRGARTSHAAVYGRTLCGRTLMGNLDGARTVECRTCQRAVAAARDAAHAEALAGHVAPEVEEVELLDETTPTGEALDAVLDAVEAGELHPRAVFRRYGIGAGTLARLVAERAAARPTDPADLVVTPPTGEHVAPWTGCTCHLVPEGATAGPMLDGHRTIRCVGCAVPIFHVPARGAYSFECSDCAEATRQRVLDVIVHRARYEAATPGTYARDLARDCWRAAEDLLTARLSRMGAADVRAAALVYEAATTL